MRSPFVGQNLLNVTGGVGLVSELLICIFARSWVRVYIGGKCDRFTSVPADTIKCL